MDKHYIQSEKIFQIAYDENADEIMKGKNQEGVFALKQLLEYAKYLEDNGQLTYGLLKARVRTYEESK